MTLHLTRDEADRLTADGRVVLFREGVAYMPAEMWSRRGPEQLPIRPPAEFVEAAKPCEACDGRGFNMIQLSPTSQEVSWCTNPDCLDGKRRIAAVVPCDHAADHGDVLDRRRCLTCTGFVTVGHVVVEWGPLVVQDENPNRTETVWFDGVDTLWLVEDSGDPMEPPVGYPLTLPPDVDPQSLVGQYAIGIEVAS